MDFILSKSFEKDFAKLSPKIKEKTIASLHKFVNDPNDTSLRNHALSGSWKDHHSINITGNIRAIYTLVDTSTVRFVAIGSHSELYG